MFRLLTLGGTSLEGPDGPLVGAVAQRRRLALLVLLASSPNGQVSRDKLSALLWPEADAKRAHDSITDAVYVLRRSLGRTAILSVGDALRLDPSSVRSDVQDFREALAAGDGARAVGLYHGPFLDGFFVADAPEFERWVEGEREQLSREHARALERLAEQSEAAGDLHAAVGWWRRLARHDPYSSRVALRLMRALEGAGDPGGALRQAEVHVALLREELGVEPNVEVAASVARLRSRPAAEEGRVGEAPPSSVPGETLSPEGCEQAAEAAPIPATLASAAGPPGAPRPRRARAAALAISVASLLLIAAISLSGRAGDGGAEPGMPIRSLAVLPLENCTPDPRRVDRPDPEQEYFADGLTDALITELAQIPGLRVTSRTSILRYKGECGSSRRHAPSLPEIARELGVDAVVEGTVVRNGERVRINAQLIRAATDEHVWADRLEYERDLRDVLGLQEEIVSAIAGGIRSRADAEARTDRPTERRVDPNAYSLYLKGRYLWNEHQLASYREALDYFQRAVAIDPGFAPAHAGMADVYVHLDEIGGRPERGAREKGFRAARRALELDDGLSEAHASLAHLLMHVEEWTAAGREYRRAVELNPSNANARILYAFYLSGLGRHEEAIQEAVRALEVDPLSGRTLHFTAYTYYFARRFDEAIAQWQRLLALEPRNWEAHFLIARAHLHAGREAEGLAWAQRGVAVAGDEPAARVQLAHGLGLAGRRKEAEDLLRDALSEVPAGGIDPLVPARAYAALGELDASFRWLDVAFEGDHGWLMFLAVEPAYDPLRADPRFQDLLRRIRLP